MSKIYTLPDGVEVTQASTGMSAALGDGAWVNHPAYGLINVDQHLLVEVTPPLPAEPPNGTVLRYRKPNPSWSEGKTDRPREIVTIAWRDDYLGNGDKRWRVSHHADELYAWAEMQPDPGETVVELVPDPAVDSPDLPWFCLDDDDDRLRVLVSPETGAIEVSVTPSATGRMCIVNPDPDQAETAGWALIEAARRARAALREGEIKP